MKISEFDIQGAIDQATRCQHYHTGKDIIAIRFYCCNRYFPCHLCHEAYGCGKGEVWPREKFNEKAILCGSCKTELTINQYINSDNTCPNCQASFNSGCSLHYHLYFEHFHPSCPFGDDGQKKRVYATVPPPESQSRKLTFGGQYPTRMV